MRPGDGLRVVGKALRHRVGRAKNCFAVAAPLLLGAVQRRPMADRDEDVLEHGATRAVRMDVSGHHGFDTQRLCEMAERDVSPRIAPLVRPLELDEEVVAAEDVSEPDGGVRVEHAETVARAARETDEPVLPLLEQRRVERRLEPVGRVRLGQQPAEIRVALRRLDEQRDVRAAVERHLCARDWANAERLRCVRELERPVHTVVVRERERLVSELSRPDYELFRLGSTIEKRIR